MFRYSLQKSRVERGGRVKIVRNTFLQFKDVIQREEKVSYKERRECFLPQLKYNFLELRNNEYTQPQAMTFLPWRNCSHSLKMSFNLFDVLWNQPEVEICTECYLYKEVLFCLSKLIAIQWMRRILKFQVH